MARIVLDLNDISYLFEALPPVHLFDGEVAPVIDWELSSTFCSYLFSWAFMLLNLAMQPPVSMLTTKYP